MNSLRQKTKVKLNDCRPGIIIAQTIYNDYGAVIVWEDTALSGHIILKLRELGIESVLIYNEDAVPKKDIPQMEPFLVIDISRYIMVISLFLFNVESLSYTY